MAAPAGVLGAIWSQLVTRGRGGRPSNSSADGSPGSAVAVGQSVSASTAQLLSPLPVELAEYVQHGWR